MSKYSMFMLIIAILCVLCVISCNTEAEYEKTVEPGLTLQEFVDSLRKARAGEARINQTDNLKYQDKYYPPDSKLFELDDTNAVKIIFVKGKEQKSFSSASYITCLFLKKNADIWVTNSDSITLYTSNSEIPTPDYVDINHDGLKDIKILTTDTNSYSSIKYAYFINRNSKFHFLIGSDKYEDLVFNPQKKIYEGTIVCKSPYYYELQELNDSLDKVHSKEYILGTKYLKKKRYDYIVRLEYEYSDDGAKTMVRNDTIPGHNREYYSRTFSIVE